MKKIPFQKMAGAGNNFLVMDAPQNINLKKLALSACDRMNGIGADGILIFDKSKKADYKMRIINADGSEAEMCGNGARCMAVYIVNHKKPGKKLFTMETLAGNILGEAKGNVASVRLSDPKNHRTDIPLNVLGRKITVQYIDTGVPHAIIFVNDIEKIDVKKIGETVRHHETFKPRGTNVNFVEQISDTFIKVRTYERGVEDETRACGTGSVASAIITCLKANPHVQNKEKAYIKVSTTGKEILDITFDLVNRQPTNVWLKGSANLIARGEYYYSEQ